MRIGFIALKVHHDPRPSRPGAFPSLDRNHAARGSNNEGRATRATRIARPHDGPRLGARVASQQSPILRTAGPKIRAWRNRVNFQTERDSTETIGPSTSPLTSPLS